MEGSWKKVGIFRKVRNRSYERSIKRKRKSALKRVHQLKLYQIFFHMKEFCIIFNYKWQVWKSLERNEHIKIVACCKKIIILKNEKFLFLRFDGRASRVVGVVMGGRRVLEVVGDDGVEDQRLHQIAIAWITTIKVKIITLNA